MKLPALTIAAVLMTGAASAATTGFTLDISGNENLPRIALRNVGDVGDITGFTLSLGDLSMNFDAAYRPTEISGSFGITLGADLDEDTNGGLRADSIEYTFTNFNPGEVFAFRADLDADNFNSVESYVDSLLPGGSIVVNFSGGVTDSLWLDLSTQEVASAYSYTSSERSQPARLVTRQFEPSAVPLPAGLPLLLVGLGALGIARRKQR